MPGGSGLGVVRRAPQPWHAPAGGASHTVVYLIKIWVVWLHRSRARSYAESVAPPRATAAAAAMVAACSVPGFCERMETRVHLDALHGSDAFHGLGSHGWEGQAGIRNGREDLQRPRGVHLRAAPRRRDPRTAACVRAQRRTPRGPP